MHTIIIGPPGAGKGTLAGYLCDRLGMEHLSTGAMFRHEIQMGTELGRLAETYISRGELVPDEVTDGMVRHLLQEKNDQSYLLDGYPRTAAQAQTLDRILAELGSELDLAVQIRVPDQQIVKRLAGRRVCPNCGAGYHVDAFPPQVEGICDRCGTAVEQRGDDREETVRERLRIYHERTEQLIRDYQERGLLLVVDNSGSLEDSQRQIDAYFQNGALRDSD